MIRLATLILALAPLTANAITSIVCVPKTKQPTVISTNGSQLRTAKADTGRWAAYWCGAPDPANAGKWRWKPQTYAVLRKYGWLIEDAIAANGGDPEAFSVLTAIINLPQVTPASGSVDEYELKTLHWSACKALTTKPYDLPFDEDFPANFCGAQPTAPPPPTTIPDVYVASPNGGKVTRQTFAATLVDGAWKRGAVDGVIDVGTKLECERIQILELGGLARFCAVPNRDSVAGATLKRP